MAVSAAASVLAVLWVIARERQVMQGHDRPAQTFAKRIP